MPEQTNLGAKPSAAPIVYHAFISYSHASDKPIASALQSIIQKLGKPWYARRALRVFRDDTSLSATPQLWSTIEQALWRSKFMILVASPEASRSEWVSREVSFWIRHKGMDRFLLVLTSGDLIWDEPTHDSLWTPTPRSRSYLRAALAKSPSGWIFVHGVPR